MAKLTNIFIHYRRVTYLVLLILVCLAARYVIAWQKGRPPNHVHVYDLTWQDRTETDSIVYRQWRYFLKPRSYLPLKIEKYAKHDPNDSYALEEMLLVDYPTDDQIREVIKQNRYLP